jgi:leader peptidase (prepilin peptidase)/N-methyltransferase
VSWVLLVVSAVVGLAVGSFLNVVIYRVPRGESIVSPPSHCPACGRPIRARHNIPVLSWLLLRGRCADCGQSISPRYPLIEVGTAVLFAAVTARLDFLGQLSAVPALLYFTAIGIALAIIDLDCRRLPNAIVFPSYPVLAAALAVAAGLEHDWWSFGRAAIGGAALFAFFFAVAYVYPAGMGFGDVKLSGLVGGVLAYLSWGTLVVGAFAGFFLGAAVGVALILSGRGGRKTAVPFGPFMILGALVGIFLGAELAQSYVDIVGLY